MAIDNETRREIIEESAIKMRQQTKPALNKEQLQEFKRLLLKQIQSLPKTIAGISNELRENLVEEAKNGLRVLSTHTADIMPTDSIVMQSSLNNKQKLLGKVLAAIQRIDSGAYGVCLECGYPIDLRRLQATPIADLCCKCKEKKEKRERQTRGGTNHYHLDRPFLSISR